MKYEKTSEIRHLQKHFGLDHLELYGQFFDESLFLGVDFENSNYFSFGEFVGVKHEVPSYMYKIMFSKNGYPYFAYYKGKKVGDIILNDYVCVYSTAFRIEGIDYVIGSILPYFHLRLDAIKRFDVCLDMILSIDVVKESIGKIEQKHEVKRGVGGVLETLYIGDRSSKNKRQFIRIYNKLLDIQVKKKHDIYQDYIIHDNITRIEIEFRRELCKNITLAEILVTENLVSIFKNYITKHTSLFDFISEGKISLYARPKPVDFDIYQSTQQKNLRVKVFNGHARTLLDIGICPVYTLMREGLISKEGKKILLETGSLDNLKLRVEKADYWVDEILSLLP